MNERAPRFITAEGLAKIRAEYDELFGVERPKMVEIVSWAASLGDRSENADYLYGKKRLREIDRRLAHLARVMKAAKVVDPAAQGSREIDRRLAHLARVMKAAKVVDPGAHGSRDQVRFGATVELADDDDERRTITIVGDDEGDASNGRIGWSAPLARALIGARVGDERVVKLPSGEKGYEVLRISYPEN